MGLSIPANARLLLVGLFLGLSSMYLRPLLSASVVPSHWLSTSHYHHRTPRPENHDPFDAVEPMEEKLRRLGSTADGGKEKEERRSAMREMAEVERRAQSAGHENKSGTERGEWPVWMVMDDIETSPVWPALARRIEVLDVPNVIVLYSTQSRQPILAKPSPYTLLSNLTIALSRVGFLPTAPSSTYPEPTFGDASLPTTPVTYLGIPAQLSVAEADLLGDALSSFRQTSAFLSFSPSLQAGSKSRSKQEKLHYALGHHSANPRFVALQRWAGKREKEVEPVVWATVGLAGDSEAEELVRKEWGEGDGQGRAWRFGDEPV